MQNGKVEVLTMEQDHVSGVVALQRACFPPPFPDSLLWRQEDLMNHLARFPEGQFVVVSDGQVIGSASNLIVNEDVWIAHADWRSTTGGPAFLGHLETGTTLYGADISVHPEHRFKGVGRSLYGARFSLVRTLGLNRFGTACRIPDWREWMIVHRNSDKDTYCRAVFSGEARDRTLSPLLRIGLQYRGVIESYMSDEESGDAAALLEWLP